MNLAKKLDSKPGMEALVIGRPPDVDLDGLVIGTDATDGVLAFVRRLREVDAKRGEHGACGRPAATQDRRVGASERR